MGLKVKQVSELAMPLAIMDEFSVVVRRLGPAQADALVARCSKEKLNPQTGQLEPRVDDALWLQHAPEAYVDLTATQALEGNRLTASTIAKLGVEVEDGSLNGGPIPLDAATLRDLWRYAHAEKFSAAILRFSREMLAGLELAKKKDSTTSSA